MVSAEVEKAMPAVTPTAKDAVATKATTAVVLHALPSKFWYPARCIFKWSVWENVEEKSTQSPLHLPNLLKRPGEIFFNPPPP